ncbi:MAG: PilZ domain-containing protein [Deltaproteobacteria bacterium]|nr:PilZ domain-containing protein [Deltaproteobacteria bacterium]
MEFDLPASSIMTLSILVTSCLITLFLLPRLAGIATFIGLLDHPNKRKVHSIPKPLIGGLAIIIGFSLSCKFLVPLAKLDGFFAGVATALIFGFLDDLRELDSGVKFAAQILASLFMIFMSGTVLQSLGDLASLGPIDLGILAAPATVFCTVGAINAINMIDGLDGLAGGLSLIAFISFTALAYINDQGELMLLGGALSGAVIGFLRYNWHPARLFMGDVGSFSLGFSVAFLAIAITQKEGGLVSAPAPLLILAVPIADTVTLMMKRVLEGKNPFRADKNHLHHLLLRLGFDSRGVVIAILSLSGLFSLAAIAGTLLRVPDYYLFFIFSMYFALYFVSHVYLKKILRLGIRAMRKNGWNRGRAAELASKALRVLDNLQVARKDERYHLSFPFLWITENQPQESAGTLINIGAGGFATSFKDLLMLGEKLYVRLFLKARNKQIKLLVTAEVVSSDREENGYRYGLRFVDLGEPQSHILKKCLAMPDLTEPSPEFAG